MLEFFFYITYRALAFIPRKGVSVSVISVQTLALIFLFNFVTVVVFIVKAKFIVFDKRYIILLLAIGLTLDMLLARSLRYYFITLGNDKVVLAKLDCKFKFLSPIIIGLGYAYQLVSLAAVVALSVL